MSTRPTIVGIDYSLTATALVALNAVKAHCPKIIDRLLIQPPCYEYMHARLHEIKTGVMKFLWANKPSKIYIEDFSRGSRFRREEMGMACAAVILGYMEVRMQAKKDLDLKSGFYYDPGLYYIPIREAKVFAAPKWYGLNKANWEAAGLANKKFKRSLPDKAAVRSGLAARFSLRLGGLSEHEVDAIAIALCRSSLPNPA